MATSKKVPAKRRKKTQNSQVTRTIFGMLLIGLSLVLLACFFVESEMDFINQARKMLWGLGGVMSVMIPVMLLWLGILLMFPNKKRIWLQRFFAILFIVICVASIMEILYMDDFQRIIEGSTTMEQTFVNYVGYAYQYDMRYFRAGGAIGAILAYPLWRVLDVWGGIIVLVILILTALLVCTNTSLTEIAGFFGVSLGKAKEQMSQWREDRAQQREQQQQEQEQTQRQERYVPMTSATVQGGVAPPVDPPIVPAMAEGATPPKRRGRKKKTEAPPPEQAYAFEAQDYYQPEGNVPQVPDPQAYTQWQQPPTYEGGFDLPQQGNTSTSVTYGEAYEAPFEQEERRPYSRVLSFPSGQEVPAYPLAEDGEDEPWRPMDINRTGYMPATDWARNFQERGATDEMDIAQPMDTPDDFAPMPYSAGPYDDVEQEEKSSSSRRTFRLKKIPERPAPGSSVDLSGLSTAPQSSPVETHAEDEDVPRRLDGTPLILPRHEQPTPVAPSIEYPFPPLRLLKPAKRIALGDTRSKDEANANKLIGTLSSFGVSAKVVGVSHGPAITRFEVQPAPGVKVSRIVGLVDDIALNMAAAGVRIEAPIPGKAAVGIEIPNDVIETVSLSELIDSEEMRGQKSDLACALGRDIAGKRIIADLAKMPHVLIAGATGSGKSVCINTLIISLLYRVSPDQVRLILIDPKVVELSVYNGVPHLLVPVVTDPKKASGALSWAVAEMERRYTAFAAYGVRDIRGYNAMYRDDGEEAMPHILVVIDELADLMMVAPGEVEDNILRLAQKARAAGIHLVIATQRPSVNVITGVIKANIPSRIAFAVSSQVDSRTILDMAGAEKLLGKGDMLYAPQGIGKPIRVQGCFVSDEEVAHVVGYIKQRYEATYSEDVEEYINSADTESSSKETDDGDENQVVDELLSQAIEMAVESGQASISMLQRRLRVGYARAGRLIDEMARRGIVGQAEGAKPREVLITREDFYRMYNMDE